MPTNRDSKPSHIYYLNSRDSWLPIFLIALQQISCPLYVLLHAPESDFEEVVLLSSVPGGGTLT